MFPDNNWYGHKYILSKYINAKEEYIFGSLQHGWISQFDNPYYENKIRFYPLLFWSKHIEDFYKFKKKTNVYSIGAPFLYLCEIFNKKNTNKSSKGTLVFPTHSSQDLKQKTNHYLLIEDIEKKHDGPYTICFYYYDLNSKDIEIYKKKNWRVVCCTRGRTDKFSLYRQFLEISKHDTIVCGELCSPLFYGMYLKKKTRISFNSNERNKHYQDKEKKMVESYRKYYPQLFDGFLTPEEGYVLGKKELGFECLKSREDLKKILGYNSHFKKLISKLFSRVYDFKFGPELRRGKDLSKKKLNLYKTSAFNDY